MWGSWEAQKRDSWPILRKEDCSLAPQGARPKPLTKFYRLWKSSKDSSGTIYHFCLLMRFHQDQCLDSFVFSLLSHTQIDMQWYFSATFCTTHTLSMSVTWISLFLIFFLLKFCSPFLILAYTQNIMPLLLEKLKLQLNYFVVIYHVLCYIC